MQLCAHKYDTYLAAHQSFLGLLSSLKSSLILLIYNITGGNYIALDTASRCGIFELVWCLVSAAIGCFTPGRSGLISKCSRHIQLLRALQFVTFDPTYSSTTIQQLLLQTSLSKRGTTLEGFYNYSIKKRR